MALFFDQDWFDALLRSRGVTRNDVAMVLKITPAQVDEVWKDQRELSAHDVTELSLLLNVPPATISLRAGVSTPVPREVGDVERRLKDLELRLEKLERAVETGLIRKRD